MFGIHPVMLQVRQVAESCFAEEGSILEVTSCVRPVSSSYHFKGLAEDYGVDNFPITGVDFNAAMRVADMIRDSLPDYFDVIFGDKNHIDHIHVEFDEKKYYKFKAEHL